MPHSHRHVRRACGTEISDRQLAQLERLAHNAANGDVSEAESEWLLASAGPLLNELIQRRQVDAFMASIIQQANVIPLRGEVS
ncbi:hypothetical protein ACVDG3_18145 [Meridianimarinicoccus sp. RP-17]|uniref:hypothetical protein n=1 Tax=Meridianimarinicoccus zhengii TaxID=2056810 RepID=UPI0013A700B8|nr:hypothetical protein [Phycocomes zhengii]